MGPNENGLMTRDIVVKQVDLKDGGETLRLPDKTISIREFLGKEMRLQGAADTRMRDIIEANGIDQETVDRMPAREQIRVVDHIWHLSGYGVDPDAKQNPDKQDDDDSAKN